MLITTCSSDTVPFHSGVYCTRKVSQNDFLMAIKLSGKLDLIFYCCGLRILMLYDHTFNNHLISTRKYYYTPTKFTSIIKASSYTNLVKKQERLFYSKKLLEIVQKFYIRIIQSDIDFQTLISLWAVSENLINAIWDALMDACWIWRCAHHTGTNYK